MDHYADDLAQLMDHLASAVLFRCASHEHGCEGCETRLSPFTVVCTLIAYALKKASSSALT